jgi:hypothetical protein
MNDLIVDNIINLTPAQLASSVSPSPIDDLSSLRKRIEVLETALRACQGQLDVVQRLYPILTFPDNKSAMQMAKEALDEPNIVKLWQQTVKQNMRLIK